MSRAAVSGVHTNAGSVKSVYRGYIGSRPLLGSRVAQHVQNLVVRSYCEQRGLEYQLSLVEYTMPESYLQLQQALSELQQLRGIVAYSLFMLPKAATARRQVYQTVLAAGAELHFALEQLTLQTPEDAESLELLRRVADQERAARRATLAALKLAPPDRASR